ncbi:MAG TPA: YkgJ family cysteine cluster protein [Candidatus Nanoarchaeia archaeon]|nr:YkgJ family cysteine cluster protein [Candidatus Nanoarchaeia archaeon]
MKQEVKTCEGCNSKCCRYVAVEIDIPEDLEDFENIRWYVSHKNINVFVDEDGKWYVEFLTECEFLNEDNLCKIYSKRPKICMEYDHDECTFNNEYSEALTFTSLEDIDSYLEKKFGQSWSVIFKQKLAERKNKFNNKNKIKKTL